MKITKRILSILALLCVCTTGAWAQDTDEVTVTPAATANEWTLEMPDADVELEVTYYSDEELAAMEEAAYTEGVELTTTAKNEWTLDAMPAFDVELEVEYETALALNEEADNTAALTEWDGYEADVTLKRTLTAGSWNTLALPFSISSDDVAKLKTVLATQSASIDFKELTSSSLSDGTLTLNFENATEIKAGQPYLVKVSKDVELATLPEIIDLAIKSYPGYTNPFKGIIVSKAIVPTVKDDVNFIPTLGKTLVTGPEGDASNAKAVLFLASGNKLVNPTVVNDAENLSSYMKGFRAYFQVKGLAAGARTFSLNLGDGEASGIEILSNGLSTREEDSIYSLDGRRVQGATKKGVYIQNGKKVIIK